MGGWDQAAWPGLVLATYNKNPLFWIQFSDDCRAIMQHLKLLRPSLKLLIYCLQFALDLFQDICLTIRYKAMCRNSCCKFKCCPDMSWLVYPWTHPSVGTVVTDHLIAGHDHPLPLNHGYISAPGFHGYIQTELRIETDIK